MHTGQAAFTLFTKYNTFPLHPNIFNRTQVYALFAANTIIAHHKILCRRGPLFAHFPGYVFTQTVKDRSFCGCCFEIENIGRRFFDPPDGIFQMSFY
jgi:hypothetical protein